MESKNDPQFWKAEGFYDLQTQAKTQKKKMKIRTVRFTSYLICVRIYPFWILRTILYIC